MDADDRDERARGDLARDNVDGDTVVDPRGHEDTLDEADVGAATAIGTGVLGATNMASGAGGPLAGAVLGQMVAEDMVNEETDREGGMYADSDASPDSAAGGGSTVPPSDAHERQVLEAERRDRD